MKNVDLRKITRVRLTVILFFICCTFGMFFYPRLLSKTLGSENLAEQTPTPPSKKKSPRAAPDPKYSKFQHKTHINLKLACDACHKFPTSNWDKVRSKETAFPDVTDYPQHQSCINCHRPQFFSGKTPAICSNCHTNPSPKDSSRHPFFNPREIFDASPKGKTAETSFDISFPHDKHIEIVSQTENRLSFVNASFKRAEESCGVCHKTNTPKDKSDIEFLTPPPKDLGDNFWLKKGTFKTAPIGHSTCFTCHNADTGIAPAPTDCGTCHKLTQSQITADFDFKLAEKIGVTDKVMLNSWKRRDSSGTFRHEFSSHAEMSCATCHNVAAMNTIDAKTKKVAILSCSPCHITATSDDGGILNYEIDTRKKDAKFSCVKCHISYGKSAIPESHTKAIDAMK